MSFEFIWAKKNGKIFFSSFVEGPLRKWWRGGREKNQEEIEGNFSDLESLR